MRFVWSLEDIQGRDWKQQLRFLEQSVQSVRNVYSGQKNTLVLYTTKNILEHAGAKGIPSLFDKIIILDYSTFQHVDPQVFWASSKLRALYNEQIPVTFLDNDLFLCKNIHERLNPKKICYSFTEETSRLYPNSLDPNIESLNLPWRLRKFAANTSFLYFPNVKVMHRYAKLSLSIMEQLSLSKNTEKAYMIFAEQALLFSFLKGEGIGYQCLVKDIWTNQYNYWREDKEFNGILSHTERDQYFKHIGIEKHSKC